MDITLWYPTSGVALLPRANSLGHSFSEFIPAIAGRALPRRERENNGTRPKKEAGLKSVLADGIAAACSRCENFGTSRFEATTKRILQVHHSDNPSTFRIVVAGSR
jgi:hypothetical protein